VVVLMSGAAPPGSAEAADPEAAAALHLHCWRCTALALKVIEAAWKLGRGLHSSTSQLNVSASCGIGGAFRGCLGSV